jgi:hypothetical protein
MMYRSTRITTAVAVVASALALAPAAFAGGVTPDNRADRTGPAGLADGVTLGHRTGPAGRTVVVVQTPDNRADRTGPAGVAAVSADTTGVGLLHASMVNAEIAAHAENAPTDSGFQWSDAGIGAAAGVGAALAAAGIAAGFRNRRRVVA